MVGIYPLEDFFQPKFERDILHKQYCYQQQQNKQTKTTTTTTTTTHTHTHKRGRGGVACHIRERTLSVPQAIVLLTIKNYTDNETL